MRSEAEYRSIINQALQTVPMQLGSIPRQLKEAMQYSLEAGGKRLRPMLLLASCEAAGGNLEEAIPFACALEMVHTYSLIHDDLPGMDNDDLRRGKPTNHKMFGEGLAILAGDGLLNGAMEISIHAALSRGDRLGFLATEILFRRAGVTGMIAGQTIDVTMEGEKPTEELVSYIHSHKTSDLIQAPMEMGLTLAGCDPDAVQAGASFGKHLGIAFQIVDDLLDVKGNAEIMGKNTGMDARKLTWVSLRGIEGAGEDARHHTALAVSALNNIPGDTSFFEKLAWNHLNRSY